MHNKQNVIIVLCKNCNGSGVVYTRTGAYDSEDVECKTCSGAGRLLETTSITYSKLKEI